MDFKTLLLVLVLCLLVLPVTSYMVVKFGTAGYLRAHLREKQKQQRMKKQ